MLGLGVLIQELSGNAASVEAIRASVGKTIAEVLCDDDALMLRFSDGTGIRLEDTGQSCCESRYMRCDDDLAAFAGHKVVDYELSDVATAGDDDVHEIQFLRVKTDQGTISVANHVEHNGYYGGFCIRASVLP